MTSTLPGSGVLSGQPIINQASTNYLWAQMVLMDAGLPTTQNNLNNMVVWMQNEEPSGNWWNRNNPLNASLGTSASDGTASYPSLTVAADYTARMIRQQNMKPIYNALANNASPSAFGAAVISSPWASGHYGGNVGRFTGNPPPIIAVGTGANLGSGGTSGDGSGSGSGATTPGVGCSSSNGLNLGVGPISLGHIFTGCQVKAITGGLLVGLGGGVLLVGAVLIAAYGLSQTGVGKAVAGVARSTPVGAVAGAVSRSAQPSARRDAANARTADTQEPYAERQARYESEGFTSTPGPGKPFRTSQAQRRRAA